MKTNKLATAGNLLAILLLSTLTLSSCNKDDDDAPAYVGTWQIESDGIDLAPKLKTSVLLAHSRDVLTLEESSYVKTYEYKYAASGWVIVDGEKGVLSEANGILTITQKQESELVDNTNQQLGIKYVDIPANEQDTFKAKWSVAGNILTILTDGNDDGDFDDLESFDDYERVFTRQ